MNPRFRLNVAAIFQREDGLVLVGERSDIPGSWQFPQGGLDPGESWEEALEREVLEEIGIPKDLYHIREKRGGYQYWFPEDHRKRRNFDGQEQTYFLCHYRGSDEDFNLTAHEEVEFTQVMWIHPQDFSLSWLPEFKREVYAQVMNDFFQVELG